MAEITQSEFYEIRTRASQEDFKTLLSLLERDEEIVLVDDPDPVPDELAEDEESEEEEDETEGFEGLSPAAESELPPVVDEHLTSTPAEPESELEIEGPVVEGGPTVDELADAELKSDESA